MSTSPLFDAPPLQFPKTPDPQQDRAQVVMVPAQAAQPATAAMTIEDVKRAVPAHLRASVTQSMVDTLNSISNDPVVAENIRGNFLSYTAVLKEGKFKTEDYIHAVSYVSFKLMGHTNEEAYARTFPQRYANLVAKGTSKKDISSYVSAFHRGKLVNLIMEQSLVPSWVLNQDLHQKALNRLADLMINARSEKVQADSAIGLLNALKKPETKGGFQINLNQAESSGMKEMKDMLGQLAQQQRDLIEKGAKTIDVAATRLPWDDTREVEDV